MTGRTVTIEQIKALITGVEYLYPESAPTLTIAVVTLKNGFCVVGESACADPRKFNADIGREIARENAERKIWALEGYLLRQALFDEAQA